MQTVRDILAAKSTDVWSILPNAKVLDALRLMADKEIGALMVIDESGIVCGIISERDYARKIVLLGKQSAHTPVEEIMTLAVDMHHVEPSTTVEECMVLMTTEHVRHLPVYEEEQFVGFLSIGDVVKSMITEKDGLIEHLSDYITGKIS